MLNYVHIRSPVNKQCSFSWEEFYVIQAEHKPQNDLIHEAECLQEVVRP